MSDSGDKGKSEDDMLADEWAKALEEQDDDEDGVEQAKLDELIEDVAGQTQVEPPPPEIGSDGGPNLDVIMDIPVTISMEVGTTDINIRNLLQLNQGSVIELDRVAGEPLDVMVNGTLIAHGEVVVVNEKFGIRLTDIISQSERIRKIN
ncbi:MAG: flagellar motor switch protein FliN [Pseudomonadales bacterium]|nr:flagellar motor switch protein FliN [Pseudomonadales bacterium]